MAGVTTQPHPDRMTQIVLHDRRSDERPGASTLVGTPAYMSPEQLWAQPSGPASDQFSFAVMAYEALFGVHPFGGRTLAERRRAVDRGPPRAHGPLERALRRALQADPAARYPSIDALLAALFRASRGVRRRLLPR